MRWCDVFGNLGYSGFSSSRAYHCTHVFDIAHRIKSNINKSGKHGGHRHFEMFRSPNKSQAYEACEMSLVSSSLDHAIATSSLSGVAENCGLCQCCSQSLWCLCERGGARNPAVGHCMPYSNLHAAQGSLVCCMGISYRAQMIRITSMPHITVT